MYPGLAEITRLHEHLSPSKDALDLIFTHCKVVRDIALQVAEASDSEINLDLVEAGALLHDIGTYSLYANHDFDRKLYITHGDRGYAIMKDEGYPEDLCRIAARHTGTGITQREIDEKNLPLNGEKCRAETIEEKIVMYADKFHTKTPTPRFNSYESYLEEAVGRFGFDAGNRFKILKDQFGVPELGGIAKKYKQQIN